MLAATATTASRVHPNARRQLRGGGVSALRGAGSHPLTRQRGRGAGAGVGPTRAFAPAAGDFAFSIPEGAAALGIVFGARVLLIGLAKAGIGRNVDKYLAKCAEYSIDTTDLYHDEDQPGDAWYLVGDWKPAVAGDCRHSDTTVVGILTTRAKTHELVQQCVAAGVDVSDVVTAEMAPDFIRSEKMRFNEINKRLVAAKGA